MLEIKDGEIKRGKYHLKNINFKIDKGRLNIVVGKNAAGKSSLLYAITGSILLEKGSINKCGLKISYVGNDVPFNEALDSDQIIDIVRKIDTNFDESLFLNYLNRFSISTSKRIRELSSGQKKLFMLSLALSRDVDLLILDEITLNIDALRKDEMKELFQDFLLTGEKSVIVSTNQLEVFENIADTVTYIKDNHIAYHGSINNLLGSYRIWQGSKEEFENLENVVGYEMREFSVEALVEDTSLGSPASLKEILIYLERGV